MFSDFKEIEEQEAILRTDCLIESKIDGTRMTWDGKELVSDRGIIRTDRYVHIAKELNNLPWKVRGEIAIPMGNILTINKKENWSKARFYIFDLNEWKQKDCSNADPFDNRKHLEDIWVGKTFQNLRMPFKFSSVKDGLIWAKKHDIEGLVLKNKNNGYKWKNYKEAKVAIVGHEVGKLHGTFLIDFKGQIGRVSATSVDFWNKYNSFLAKNIIPYAEIEYLFITPQGLPFQPRLRRLDTLAELLKK
jgi:ATP-dependent DNA ligase